MYTRTSLLLAPSTWKPLLLLALSLIGLSGCKLAGHGQNLAGVRSYQQGQYQIAMQQFQKAIAADPKNADAYYNMAATVHRMGTQRSDAQLLQQAETLYNQCLDLDSNHADCYRGLAVLLVETERSDRAFTLLKNWAMANPQAADAHVELARLHEEFGRRDTAKLQLQQALQVDQYHARAWAALARLREQDGDFEQALANYQRSYNLNSMQPQVADRIATLQRSVSSQYNSSFSNTRMVNSQPPAVRY